MRKFLVTSFLNPAIRTMGAAALLATCLSAQEPEKPPAPPAPPAAPSQPAPPPAAAVPQTVPAAPPAPMTRGAFPASRIREEVMGEVSAGSEVGIARSSGDHLAWVEKNGGKQSVRIDGKQSGGVYDEVKYLRFSESQQHVAFVAKRRSKWVLVLDGQERSQEYGRLTAPVLSPSGLHFAAGACQGKRCRPIVDGEEVGPEFEDISFVQFSKDGEHYAFLGKRKGKWVLALDGKELGPEMNDFESWGFHRGGEHVAVAARLGKDWTWVVDGAPGPGLDVLSLLDYSADGKHFVYGGTDANWGFKKQSTKGVIVVDGQIKERYEGKGFGGGWKGMFGVQEQIRTGVSNLSPDFHGVSDPQYSSDGKLIYAGRRGTGDVAVYVDGVAGPGFEDIVSPIAITEEARDIAYIGKRGDFFVEVRNQQPGASFPGKREVSYVESILLSSDGKHLAYQIVRGGSQFKAGQTRRALRRVVLDGRAGVEYDALNIASLRFSPGKDHFAYEVEGAQKDRDMVVCDGLEGKLYDNLFIGSLKFLDDQTLEFVARDGRRFLRVTQTLE
ncbi:MAG: hypothetical protein LAN71_03890 [Acidobacteriia bacterium]|nr:hypothetical protein [Terriglobia bacterium]